MAQFSLTLINKHGSTVLTDYDTMAGKTAGLTFNEQLNLNVDGSTLDFSMLKYLYEGSQKVVNTPTVSITYGSIIKCLHNGRRYDFAVTDINYQFLPENLQLTFSAQDYFQFETSKQGIGYSITGDTTDPAYFGAQPIDAWAYKIIQDNNLRWGYVPINQANREWINTALSSTQKTDLFDTNINTETYDYWNNHEEYSLNQWVSFECSESSAYNALKQLASENDLIIVVDYGAHNFWFAPKHNVIFNGYYFNPQNNLQQLGIKGSAQNLITVLDVTGPIDINNQEITLVPLIPSDLFSWIMSDEWSDSVYYPTLYADHTTDIQFQREAAYTPWLENKLIDYSFFESNNLILPSEAQKIQDILYNDLRIANGQMLVQQQQYLRRYGEQYSKHTQNVINAEAVTTGLMGDVDSISSLVFSDKPACFAIVIDDTEGDKEDNKKGPWLYWPDGYTLYTTQYPEPVDSTSLSEGGPYHDFLYSPEIGEGKVLYPNCKVSIDANFPQTPFVTTVNNYSHNVSWFSKSDEEIKYNSFNLMYGSVSGDYFLLTFNKKCTKFQIQCNVQYGSPKFALIEYNGINITASGRDSSGNWHQPQIVSNDGIYITDFAQVELSENTATEAQIRVSITYNQLYLSIIETDPLLIEWKYDNNLKHTLTLQVDKGKMKAVSFTNATNGYLQINDEKINIPAAGYEIPYSSQPTSFKANTKVSSGNVVKHVQVNAGVFEFYGKLNDSTTNRCTIKLDSVDDTSAGSLCFQQLKNAITLTKDFTTTHEHSAILIDCLNQLCGSRDGYWQTLAKNAYEFLTFWHSEHGGKETGPYVLKMQDVSFVEGQDNIGTNSQYYDDNNSPTFSQEDINFLQKALDKTSLTRVDVITYLQSSISYLTEKWNNCHAAAMGLGIYLPSDWNNSRWLLQHTPGTSVYDKQVNLISQLSPLIFKENKGNGAEYNALDLVPNLAFFPITDERYTDLKPNESLYVSQAFVDKNKYKYYPSLVVSDNTEIRAEDETTTDTSDIYKVAWNEHTQIDNLQLQKVPHSSKIYKSNLDAKKTIIPAQILATPLPEEVGNKYPIENPKANPNLYIIEELAQHPLYDTDAYYRTLAKHDECWQTLYQDYPGIFRESTYTNSTATSSHELYVAAKAQLDNLSRPSFEYSLTGMDIYMHDSDYTPTRLTLGEQIRIDYQDPDQLTDTLNAALREPLYITGISHALRNDGDYQFTVTTRTATDSMVQRFAQLLSFGR